MERIGHLGGPGHHGVEDGPIGTREIEGCPLDPRAELEPLVIEPLRRPAGASTRDDIEELAGSDIHDRGGELLTAITAPTHEEHLVEPERTDVSKAPGVRRPAPRHSATTASLTVCQSHPSSLATSATLLAQRPTWAVTQRPARSVIAIRGAAIRGSCSVQLPIAQSGSSQRHRRLCQCSRVGLPKAGRSTSTTSRQPLNWATTPHVGQPTGRATLLDV